MKAFTWLNGVIEFGRYMPTSATLIASAREPQLSNVIKALATVAADGETLMVPGVKPYTGTPSSEEYFAIGRAIGKFRDAVNQRLQAAAES